MKNEYLNRIKEVVKRRKMNHIFLLFVCLVSMFSYKQWTTGYTIEDVTLDQIMKKEGSPVIIYFARDDCPDCQEMDSYLRSNREKLPQTVYRIETRKEPNQHQLKQLLDEHNITKVPTFVQREGQEFIKLKLKKDAKKIVFLRLS